jgi:hypothetical protein
VHSPSKCSQDKVSGAPQVFVCAHQLYVCPLNVPLPVQALKLGEHQPAFDAHSKLVHRLCASLVLSHFDGNMLFSYVAILHLRSRNRQRASIHAKPCHRLAHSWLIVYFMVCMLLNTCGPNYIM